MERRNNYNDLKPFRFWCQKVLPLVYDDSLSYYELLDKVIDYLNKTMEDVTVLNDDTEALYAAYNQLQSYVNSYFDNLDVQQEIDNKLDAMVLDGTLTRLVRPFVGEAVSDWLEDNVNPVGSAVIVDASLTIEGAAADAAAVGRELSQKEDVLAFDDAPTAGSLAPVHSYGIKNYVDGAVDDIEDEITDLKGDLNELRTRKLYNIFNPNSVFDGYRMDNNTGQLVEDSAYIASDYMLCEGLTNIMLIDREGGSNSTTDVSNPSPGGLYWNFYDENKSFIRSGNTGTNPANVPLSAKYARFRASKQNYTNSINNNKLWGVFGVSALSELKNWTFYQVPQNMINDSPYAINGSLVHPKIISCWGDSLTDGTGDNNAYGYPNRLANLIGSRTVNVNNFGLGGQTSLGIARRLSAMPVYVNPFTIPADTSAVNVALFDNDGQITSLFNRGGSIADANLYRACINPCIISGIEGTLTQTDRNGGYTFARKTAGDSIEVSRPALLETWGYRNQRNDITIIWAGTNDISSWMSISWTMENIIRMIETLTHDKYIILGLTSKYQFPDIVNRNNAMFRKFGRHFLDVRDYLLKYGLSDNGITPTAQDLIDIENGEIPSSIRSDEIHFKNYGYQSIAKCINIRGKELGYW